MHILRLLLYVVLLAGVSGCHRSVEGHGVTRTSTNGVVYFCQVVEVDSSAAPIVVVGRSGGQGRDYSLKCEMSESGFFVDGVLLTSVTAPTLYFKEDGKLKTKVISKSGVWLALFSQTGPTLDELQRVFEQLEHDK